MSTIIRHYGYFTTLFDCIQYMMLYRYRVYLFLNPSHLSLNSAFSHSCSHSTVPVSCPPCSTYCSHISIIALVLHSRKSLEAHIFTIKYIKLSLGTRWILDYISFALAERSAPLSRSSSPSIQTSVKSMKIFHLIWDGLSMMADREANGVTPLWTTNSRWWSCLNKTTWTWT